MRREALPNPADSAYPYNPEAAAWLANYYNRWEYNYGGGGGGGSGGGVNTVTGFWDRNASTAGMLGLRYENSQYIDNATSNIVPFSVIYDNYVVPRSSESYTFNGNNIEWGYWAGVASNPNKFLTLVLTDGTNLKFDFTNELRDISNTVNTPIRNYAVADITEQICAGALNFALGLFFGGILEIGFLRSSVATQTGLNAVENAANSAKSWLGRNADWVLNKSGDVIFTSEDGLRKLRYNTINSHGDLPYIHLEEFIRGKWRDAIPGIHRIYPKP